MRNKKLGLAMCAMTAIMAWATSAQAQSRGFMKITVSGNQLIRGESQDEKHKDWIEIQQVNLAPAAGGQARTATGTQDTMKRTVTGAAGSETTIQRKAGGDQENTQRAGTPAPPGAASAGPHSLRLLKYLDRASPSLRQAAAAGRPFSEVVIELTRLNERTHASEVYLRYKLENVMVSSIRMGSGGNKPTEEITLSFAKILEETAPTGTPSTARPFTQKP